MTALDEILAQIDALGDLKQGWNSYNAPPISAESREMAKAVARLILTTPMIVGPTPNGTVTFLWRDGSRRDFDFEIDAAGWCAGSIDDPPAQKEG